MQKPLAKVNVGFVKVIIKEYFNSENVLIENLLIKIKEFMLDNKIKTKRTIKKNINVILKFLFTLYIILVYNIKIINK